MPPLLKNISIPNLFTQFRYITRVKETPWKRKYLRRFGYDDPLLKRPDTLPRIPEDNKYVKKGLSHLNEYRPPREWSDKEKYFGQNDYIDILGDGSIHPVKLLTNMPAWLRGFQGNEFQMLLIKQQAHAHYRWTKPTKWMHMNKRVMFLYRYLNRKTPNDCGAKVLYGNITNKNVLIEKLIQIWYHDNEIQINCENLIQNMPRRIESLIKNKGMYTKY